MNLKSTWMLGLCGLFLAINAEFGAADDAQVKEQTPATVAEKPASEKAESEKAGSENDAGKVPGESKAAESGPFKIPADATPAELMKFLEELLNKEPQVENQEEAIAYYTKVVKVMMQVTTQILDAKDAAEPLAHKALSLQFDALDLKSKLGERGITKMELALAEKYAADPRQHLAKLASDKLLFARLNLIKEIPTAEQEKVLDAAVVYIKNGGRVGPGSLRAAIDIVTHLDLIGYHELGAKACDLFEPVFVHALSQELVTESKVLKAMGNRMRLGGHPIEIEGSLVNGAPIDWAAYRGKVVLVDFWATWCKTCVAELPNLQSVYKAYHAKGFEVVGVSLDDKQELVEKFIERNHLPWENLFSADPKATGMEHPLVTKYGIMKLPFTALVGKDGNVIKMNIHGTELREALEKLLGPPDAPAPVAE